MNSLMPRAVHKLPHSNALNNCDDYPGDYPG